MIFRPTYIRERRLCQSCFLLSVTTDDGVELEGAVYEPQNAKTTLLMFLGRSHDAVALLNRLSQMYPKSRIITCNYRGYGKSAGMVNEKNILQDAFTIAELVEKNYGDFYLLGYSLGSSVAAYVASKHRVLALFLIGAFDSIEELVRDKYAKIPYLVKLVHYKFPTMKYMQNVEAETYLFVSSDDALIPLKNARNLKKHSKNVIDYKELEGLSHAELFWDSRVINKINEVIANG